MVFPHVTEIKLQSKCNTVCLYETVHMVVPTCLSGIQLPTCLSGIQLPTCLSGIQLPTCLSGIQLYLIVFCFVLFSVAISESVDSVVKHKLETSGGVKRLTAPPGMTNQVASSPQMSKKQKGGRKKKLNSVSSTSGRAVY